MTQNKKKGLIKRLVASAGVGAGVGVLSKNTLTQTQDHVVQINDLTVNNYVLGLALQQKWQKYNDTNADLTTQKGWLDLSQHLKDIDQPMAADYCMYDYYLLSRLARGKVSFEQFLKSEDLIRYVSEQDGSQTLKDGISAALKNSLESTYELNTSGTDFQVCLSAVNIVGRATKGEDVEKFLDAIDTWHAWQGDINPEEKFSSILHLKFSDAELSSMTGEQKGQYVMDYLSRDSIFEQYGGYSGDALIKYQSALNTNTSAGKTSAAMAIDQYQDFLVAKHWASDSNYYSNPDVANIIASYNLSSNAELKADVNTIMDNRKEILEDAIEQKYDLPNESLNIKSTNSDIPSQVSQDMQEEVAKTLNDSASYFRHCNNPVSDNMSLYEQIDQLGVRDQIKQMIDNGDTYISGTDTVALSDQGACGLAGVGTLATFVALSILNARKNKKIKQICAENPEAAQKYNEYLQQQAKEKAEKKNKKGKKASKDEKNSQIKR